MRFEYFHETTKVYIEGGGGLDPTQWVDQNVDHLTKDGSGFVKGIEAEPSQVFLYCFITG